LTALDLSWNGIKDNGFNAISEALKKNHTIKSLSLNKNSIEEEGVNSLVDALHINRSLTSLSLIQTAISESKMDEIKKILDRNANGSPVETEPTQTQTTVNESISVTSDKSSSREHFSLSKNNYNPKKHH